MLSMSLEYESNDSFEERGSNSKFPKLILIRGLPGAGKSHLAELLIGQMEFEEAVFCDPDKVITEGEDFLRFLEENNEEGMSIKTMIYRFLLKRAAEGLKNRRDVIWDQPWRSIWGIEYTLDFLNKYLILENTNSPYEVCVVELNVSVEEAFARVKRRIENGGHGPDEEVFNRFVAEYEPPQKLGDRAKIIELNGELQSDQLVQILLSNLGFYEQ